MKRSIKTGAGLIASAVLTAALVTPTVAQAGHNDRPGRPAAGYVTVRSGIPVGTQTFTVTSPDVRNGGTIPATAWAGSLGCTGGDEQIRLAWSGAPKGTRSFAVSMQDVDAPTGSGFWHWMIWDIPATERSVGSASPAGAVAGLNDAGIPGYLGPCPPAGDIAHRYILTVYALDTPTVGLPAGAPSAAAAFTMYNHIIGAGRLTAYARR